MTRRPQKLRDDYCRQYALLSIFTDAGMPTLGSMSDSVGIGASGFVFSLQQMSIDVGGLKS